MTTVVFPDSMADLKVWLATHPLLVELVPGGVFFRFPNNVTYPAIRLYQSGGGPVPGEAPEDELRVSLEVWGGAGTDYPALRQVVAAIKSMAQTANNILPNPAGTTLLLYVAVNSVFDAPDADAGQPRIVVDLVVNTRLA